MLDHLPLLSIPIILELYMSKINKKTHVVNLPYLAPFPFSSPPPPFFSLLYGLRLVRTAAIKTDYELISFFLFYSDSLGYSTNDKLASGTSVSPSFYRFIYHVSSGGGELFPPSSSLVGRYANKGRC